MSSSPISAESASSLKRSVSFGSLQVHEYSIYDPPMKRVRSLSTLVKEGDGAQKYKVAKISTVSLDKLKDHPNLCIAMITDTVLATWYNRDDYLTQYNGKFITALLEQALNHATPETCFDWLQKKICQLRGMTDLYTPRQFCQIQQTGWIAHTDETRTYLADLEKGIWAPNEEREVQLQVPALEAHLKNILAIQEIQDAIAKCFELAANPSMSVTGT